MVLYCTTIIFIHSLVCVTFAIDYCTICPNRTHTMCKYPQGPSKSCFGYRNSTITWQIKKDIVDLHNQLRNKVASGNEKRGNPGPQPQASNMLLMKWDEELAAIAQRFAEQCISYKQKYVHECKNTERFTVGQNIISTVHKYNQSTNLTYMINFWYNEVEHFNKENVHKFDSTTKQRKIFGHYTQMVWANTEYVGCGSVSFMENTTIHSNVPSPYLIHRLVCNYGPAGNLYGTSVYKIGTPCSMCSAKNCDKKFNALCKDTMLINDKKYQHAKNATIIVPTKDTNISKQHQDIISKTTTVPVFVLSTRSGVIVCHTLMTRRKVCFNYVVRRTIDGDVSKKSQCINSASKCYFTVLHIYICTLVTYLFRQLLSH